MPVDNESLKRVLLHIKEIARDFKRDGLKDRLKPEVAAAKVEAEPAEELTEPAGLAESMESPVEEKEVEAGPQKDEELSLDAIRKLLERV